MQSKWRIIGASARGSSHEKSDLPCQDAYDYRGLSNGVLIVAVSDGAGSADRSDEGAARAVRQATYTITAELEKVETFSETAWHLVLTEAFSQARQAVFQLAENKGLPPRDFATTLTCVVASDRWLATGQIGDGVVIAARDSGGLSAVTVPQRGEYANETLFLTASQALQSVDVRVYNESPQALAVMTDGLMRLAMDVATNEPHVRFFEPLLSFASGATDELLSRQKLVSFLASERVCSRTDDDKTLVLAVRLSGVHPEKPELDVRALLQKLLRKMGKSDR